jgi:hypothetical protein
MNAQWEARFSEQLEELMKPSPEWVEWERKYDEKKAEEKLEQKRREEIAARLLQQRDDMPYTEALATELCERVRAGELMTTITSDPHMPTARNVARWLKQHSDFAALYNIALQDRLVIFEEDIVRIADEIPKEPQRATQSSIRERVQFVDPIMKARLQIESRIRWLKALKPQRWADQSTLNVKEADPFDVSHLSSEEIEARIASIEAKERIVADRPRLEKSDLFK